MSTAPLGIGVIGSGAMGRLHAGNLLRGVPGGRLITVSDADPARAAALAADTGVRASATSDEVIEDPRVDAVIVATPTDTHAAITTAAAKAGKHVLCEKPLAQTAAEAEQMIAAVERAGVQVRVAFQRRFDPDHRRAFELIRSGELGRPRLYLSSFREPAALDSGEVGDFILHFAVHDLDVARWLIGEVEEITTIGQTLHDGLDIGRDPENLVTTVRFANGALGVLDTGASAAYGFECRFEVVGDRATARVSRDLAGNVETLRDGLATRPVALDAGERFSRAYVDQLDAFCRDLREGTTTGASVFDGHAALVLVEASEISLREARCVRLRQIGASDAPRYEVDRG